MKAFSALLAVAGLICSTPSVLAQLTNGGFERGDLTGWTGTASLWAASPPTVTSVSLGQGPTEGQYLAELFALPGGPMDGVCYSQLEQQFSAVAGQSLLFDWYAVVSALSYTFEGGDWSAFAQARVSVYQTDLGSPLFQTCIFAYAGSGQSTGNGTGGWRTDQVAFDVSGSYTLQFRIEGQLMATGPGEPDPPAPPMTGGFIGVDNVRLVPEPPAFVPFAALGLALLAHLWQRRRKAV